VKGRFVVPMVGLSFSTDRKPLVRLAFFEAQAVVALQIAIGLVYAVRPEGANHQWRKISPGELSIASVADERLGWVTDLVEAS
jgi:hypothetical protein